MACWLINSLAFQYDKRPTSFYLLIRCSCYRCFHNKGLYLNGIYAAKWHLETALKTAHKGTICKTPLTASRFPDKLSALLILPSLPCRLTHHPLWCSDVLWHLNVSLGNAVPSFQYISPLALEANTTQQKKLSKQECVGVMRGRGLCWQWGHRQWGQAVQL